MGVVLSVVVVVLLFIGIISIAISALDSDKETKVKANSILKITLSKPIVDRASDNPFENLSITNIDPETEIEFKSILDNIEKAKTDDRIKGIYLNVPFVNAGLAQTEEIRNKLLDFKTTGKFIISYAENYSQNGYYYLPFQMRFCYILKVFLNSKVSRLKLYSLKVFWKS